METIETKIITRDELRANNIYSIYDLILGIKRLNIPNVFKKAIVFHGAVGMSFDDITTMAWCMSEVTKIMFVMEIEDMGDYLFIEL